MIDQERVLKAAEDAAYEANGNREVSYTVEHLIQAAVGAALHEVVLQVREQWRQEDERLEHTSVEWKLRRRSL